MKHFFTYLVYRLVSISSSFIGITAIVYASLLLFTPEARASLYLSPRGNRTPETTQQLISQFIERYQFDDPFHIQYPRWFFNLFQGRWGHSPLFNADVFDVITLYAPTTLELLLYSLILFLPLGVFMGALSGRRKDTTLDHAIRYATFIASSIPLFVLAFVFLAVFYVALGWFAPGRLDVLNTVYVNSPSFQSFTGFMTIDGLLNGRFDICVDALRHLVMPAITLSILHWATLTRLTRALVIEESYKDYVLAARSRGLEEKRITWRHILINCLSPILTTTALTAATLTTELFIVELIFNYKGLTQLIDTVQGIPDGFAIMGFIVVNLALTLLLIFILDVLKAFVDPLIREEVV